MKDAGYYKNLYRDFITSRKKRKQIFDYMENHHIKPRCMGGIDNKKNMVLLNPKEHYFAHLLLYKSYPKNVGLKRALGAMVYGSRLRPHKALNSRAYQKIRDIVTIKMPKKNDLLKLYFVDKLSYKKIGKILNVSDMTVCKWFKLYNINAKNNRDYSFSKPLKSQLVGKSPYHIKKEFNVSLSLVYKWLKFYNINLPKLIGIKKPRPSKKDLNTLYNIKKFSIKNISKHYNVSMPLVRVWFKELKIKKIRNK